MNLRAIAVGMVGVFCIMLFGLLLNALLVLAFNIDNLLTLRIMLFLNLCSLLLGGIFVGRVSRLKGWLNGGAFGILYAVLLHLFAMVFFDSLQVGLGALALSFFLGAVGGIAGVNLAQ